MRFEAAKQEVLATCLALAERGYLAGTGGNIALRADSDHLAVTPSATDYYSMTAADICVVRLSDEKQVEGGGNIAIHGDERVCIGTTPDRLVLNAELFEKCAKAFVVAYASGHRVRKVPGWARIMAGGRLRKDQKRAAESYAAGRVPQGMNAY